MYAIRRYLYASSTRNIFPSLSLLYATSNNLYLPNNFPELLLFTLRMKITFQLFLFTYSLLLFLLFLFTASVYLQKCVCVCPKYYAA